MVLLDCQNQLEFSKCELHETESKLNCLVKTNEVLQQQLDKLNDEMCLLKTTKCTVQRENDFYKMSLDKKCEKLQNVESKIECVNQLKDDNRMLKKRIE